MKKSQRSAQIIKLVFRGAAALLLVVGLGFSYLIAELNDAPGMMIFGPAFVLAGSAIVYGVGEVILLLRKNQQLLAEIHDKDIGKKK